MSHFACPRCPYTTHDWRNLIGHRRDFHGENVTPWRLSVKPNNGAIIAYRRYEGEPNENDMPDDLDEYYNERAERMP